MATITNILILHDGNNVDGLKRSLEIQFPMLERVITANIANALEIVHGVPYLFHCCILTPGLTERNLPEFPYKIEILSSKDTSKLQHNHSPNR